MNEAMDYNSDLGILHDWEWLLLLLTNLGWPHLNNILLQCFLSSPAFNCLFVSPRWTICLIGLEAQSLQPWWWWWRGKREMWRDKEIVASVCLCHQKTKKVSDYDPYFNLLHKWRERDWDKSPSKSLLLTVGQYMCLIKFICKQSKENRRAEFLKTFYETTCIMKTHFTAENTFTFLYIMFAYILACLYCISLYMYVKSPI